MAVEKRDVMNCFKSKRSEKEIIAKAADIEEEKISEYMRTIILRESMRIIKKSERVKNE